MAKLRRHGIRPRNQRDRRLTPLATTTPHRLAGYDSDSLGERSCERVVQTKAERRERDALQVCHWTISLLKRWLLGTHAGAVSPKHLQSYLDEFAFRHVVTSPTALTPNDRRAMNAVRMPLLQPVFAAGRAEQIRL